MAELNLEDWFPMSPLMGPPLPEWLGLTWPWYKEEGPPPLPPALTYSCPYCDQSFDTVQELIGHVTAAHPDQPPLGEIAIDWE